MMVHPLYQLEVKRASHAGYTFEEWLTLFGLFVLYLSVFKTFLFELVALGAAALLAFVSLQVWLFIKDEQPRRFVQHFFFYIFEYDTYLPAHDTEQLPLVLDPDIEITRTRQGAVTAQSVHGREAT
jgi:hypothetical protein